MRVRAQVHPGFRFLLEIGLVLFHAEIFRPGRFDRQVDAPAPVPNAIDQASASPGENLTDLVESQDHIAGLPGYRDFFVTGQGALRRERCCPRGEALGDPRPGRGAQSGALFGRRWPGRPGRHQVKKRIRLLELRNGLLKLGLKLRAQSAQFLRGNVPSLSLLFLPTFEQLQQSLRARH